MTTTAPNITFDTFTSDATFRTWASAVSSALQTCGLVQTSDTGQINLTTVTRSGSGGEFVFGYEVYRFNDALQATKPVYLKIEYGAGTQGSSGWTVPVVFVTVGTGTNGAGTLTGIVGTRTRVSGGNYASAGSASAAPSSTSPCFFSGDGSYICMALGVQSTAQPLYNGYRSCFPAFMVIDRTRDTAGAATSQGLVILACNWTASGSATQTLSPLYQLLSFTANQASTQEGYWPVAFPGQAFAGSVATGTDYAVWPLPLATPAYSQALAVLGIYKGEAAVGAMVSLTVLGSTHTYVCLGGIGGTSNGDAARGQVNTSVASGAVLMRYE